MHTQPKGSLSPAEQDHLFDKPLSCRVATFRKVAEDVWGLLFSLQNYRCPRHQPNLSLTCSLFSPFGWDRADTTRKLFMQQDWSLLLCLHYLLYEAEEKNKYTSNTPDHFIAPHPPLFSHFPPFSPFFCVSDWLRMEGVMLL